MYPKIRSPAIVDFFSRNMAPSPKCCRLFSASSGRQKAVDAQNDLDKKLFLTCYMSIGVGGGDLVSSVMYLALDCLGKDICELVG